MAELSALALTLRRVLTVINRRHWRHRLPHGGRDQALQSQFNKGPRREIFEELDMLCTSRERQHTVSAEIRRSSGLLHLVCIPQPATGGSDLWKIPPLRHSGLMKAEIKGGYQATVWNWQ